MKFSVKINGVNFLLDANKVAMLVQMLDGAEYLHEKWVGTGKGSHGSDKNYDLLIEQADPAALVQLTAVSDDYLATLRLVKKLNQE
jgi:hypothetical protein